MSSGLMNHIRETAKDDVRLFFAPFVGAVKGVKEEIRRIQRKNAAARKNKQ